MSSECQTTDAARPKQFPFPGYNQLLIGLAVVTALTVGGFFAYLAAVAPADQPHRRALWSP